MRTIVDPRQTAHVSEILKIKHNIKKHTVLYNTVIKHTMLYIYIVMIMDNLLFYKVFKFLLLAVTYHWDTEYKNSYLLYICVYSYDDS